MGKTKSEARPKHTAIPRIWYRAGQSKSKHTKLTKLTPNQQQLRLSSTGRHCVKRKKEIQNHTVSGRSNQNIIAQDMMNQNG